jgi:Holliday junction resolvasome RuvABC ATP-dependent DNA helicase subunit
LKLNCDEIIFNDGSEKLLGGILRGNARSAVKVAELVNTYCVRFDKDTFDEKDFFELCKLTNILPYGIMSNELSILRELNARGSCSLQMLASATGLSRTTIQKDIEGFMLKNGYMRIDGQRKITTFGQKVLKECQEFFDKVNGVTAAA